MSFQCTFHNEQTPIRHELYVQHTYFAVKSEEVGVNPPLTCFKVYYGSLRLLWAWVTCGYLAQTNFRVDALSCTILLLLLTNYL